VRIPTAIAGCLALAAAAMVVAAFTTGGDGEAPVTAPSVTTTAQAPGAPSGLTVWVQQGCGSCHTLAAANAHGRFGPDLGSSLRGKSAAAVERSIVDPNAESATGFEAGMMPEDYATRMAPGDLERLVGFLRTSAR
jgi:mono/diheme cytochrome c family protein